MAASVMLDTNVLVYAHDRSEPEKQQRALEVLERVQSVGSGALTTQVLAEFFSTAIRKLSASLSMEAAARQVELFARAWPVLDVTTFTVLEAIRGKPVPPEKEGLVHGIGLMLLLALLVVITIQDIFVPLPQGFNWSEYLY